MKLISCGCCAVVLDTDRIIEPDIYDEDGTTMPNVIWDGDKYTATIICPICESSINYENGDW